MPTALCAQVQVDICSVVEIPNFEIVCIASCPMSELHDLPLSRPNVTRHFAVDRMGPIPADKFRNSRLTNSEARNFLTLKLNAFIFPSVQQHLARFAVFCDSDSLRSNSVAKLDSGRRCT